MTDSDLLKRFGASVRAAARVTATILDRQLNSVQLEYSHQLSHGVSMGERRILVIGSQCQAASRPLSFLPGLAQEVYAVMTDAKLGGCVPALSDGGLRIDPSVVQAQEAIERAFERASEDAATLFLAFIGHGQYVGSDFYLLPYDASLTPTSRSAIHLIQMIKEARRIHDKGDGLVVLLDACHSGVGAAGASAEWVGELYGTMRFEVLTATDDRTAADGCFSRNIAAIVREGIAGGQARYAARWCGKFWPIAAPINSRNCRRTTLMMAFILRGT